MLQTWPYMFLATGSWPRLRPRRFSCCGLWSILRSGVNLWFWLAGEVTTFGCKCQTSTDLLKLFSWHVSSNRDKHDPTLDIPFQASCMWYLYIYIQSICPLINDNASFDWSNHGFPGNTFELRCVTSGNCILPVMVLHLFIKFGRLWDSIWFKLSLYRYKKHIWNIFQPLWMTHNIQQVALFCTVFQIKLVPSTSPWCGGLWSPARRSWTEDPRQWEDLEPTMYSWI